MSQMNKKRPLHGKKTEKSDNFLGRVSIKTIVLSVVALIQIMLLITGTTFSWVETISSLALTGGGKIDNPVMTVANIGSGTGYDKALDLDAYFKKAGNVHLSTCSSADGQNFYFPIVGDNNNYRQSTVNDRNVNYIGYNLKVVNKEENKSEDFKFGNIPSIKIGNKEVDNNRVRIAITVDGVTKIFSNKDDTENVVAATDGKLSKTTVNAFDKYTNSDEKVTLPVFSIPANSSKEVKISLWLQDSNGGNNGDVAVNDFTLVVSKKCVEVKYGTDSDSTMGDISIGSNNQQICYGEEGKTVPLNATAKLGYKFMGWYKDSGCTIKAPVEEDGKFKIGSDSKYTLYALFKKTYTVNVIAVTDNVQGGTGGTVKINSGTASDKAIKSDVTVGETVKLTATPNEGYDFVGWYDSATEDTPQITGENPANVEIDSVNPTDRTIYARFEIKKYTVTASAVSEDDDDNKQGNKITYGNEQKAQVKVIVNHGGSVTFTAKPADGSGYVFDGWYSDKACSSANKLSSEESYTVSSVKADKNIYAKFVLKRYTVDVYAYCYNDKTPDLSEQVNYGKIKSDNETLETHTTRIVKYGTSFSFTAVGNENCEFEGWYNKADDTLIDRENVYSVDSFKGDSQTSENKKSFYAKFKIKTKRITVHSVKNNTTDTSTVNINHTLTADTINYGETATISAEPGANSEFKGWFTDEACTEKVGDNYLDLNLSVTVNNDTPTNYYAKFEKKTTVTVYFKNVPGWTPPYAYVWYDKTHNESIEMTKVSDNYYKVDIDVKYTNIIFKNNIKDDWTGQTKDSPIPKIGNEKNCFIYDTTYTQYNGYWTKYVEETPAEKYTIYLTNNMGWNKVYCYAWNATMTTGKFPGVEMTDTTYKNEQNQAVYKVEIDSTYTSLVFSNGNDKNQTVDVTGFKNGTAYYLKEDKDKKGHYNVDTWTYIPSN